MYLHYGSARCQAAAAKMLTFLKVAAQLTEKRSLKYSYSTLLCSVQSPHITRLPL